MRKRHAALALSIGMAVAGTALAFQPRYEMRFWFDDESAARAAGAIEFEPHPCGAVAIAPVGRMPAFDGNAVLGTELIVEYGEGRREIRRWSTPVDGSIWAVRGNELLVDQGDGFYWIDTAGGIRPAERRNEARAVTRGDQCAIPAELEGSAYTQCTVHEDEGDGRPRILAYEGICS